MNLLMDGQGLFSRYPYKRRNRLSWLKEKQTPPPHAGALV